MLKFRVKKIYVDSFSQSNQESFVLNMLQGKSNGFYLEIGGHDGFAISNTSLLETQFHWQGVALDISGKCVRRYNKQRNNICLKADATKFDYEEYLNNISAPFQIDYLQVDIEPAKQSLLALKALPLLTRRFSVITFEHDLYAFPENNSVQRESREILKALGYELVVGNVKSHGNPYEDWWVDPAIVDSELIENFRANDLDDYAIFKGCVFI